MPVSNSVKVKLLKLIANVIDKCETASLNFLLNGLEWRDSMDGDRD